MENPVTKKDIEYPVTKKDIEDIKELLRVYQNDSNARHDEFSSKLGDIKDRLDPIASIYESFQGFGSVVWWVFRFLIVPLSVIVGIFYSFKKIL